MPLPCWIKLRVPLPFWIEPAKEVLEEPAIVRLTFPLALSVIAPPVPLKLPTFRLLPFRSNCPPFTVSEAEVDPRAVASLLPIRSVPAVTVVPPLYELVPVIVVNPANCVTLPLPLMLLANVVPLAGE